MHSDNGTNFVGAANEYNRIHKLIQKSKESILHHVAQHNIMWKFNPPRTPHMGGLWEAAVKAMKLLMRKTLQSQLLKVDELTSVLVEIEAVLNSRPLAPLETTDPDNIVLTLGHFLIGRPLLSPPTQPVTAKSLSSLRRWQLVQYINQDLWQTWKTSYLQTLQQKHKWNGPTKPYRVGDVVFLREETFAYRQWPLARVTRLMSGDNGIMRVVELLCKRKTLQRATIHLIPFLNENQEDDKEKKEESTNSPASPRPPSLFRSPAWRRLNKLQFKAPNLHPKHLDTSPHLS